MKAFVPRERGFTHLLVPLLVAAFGLAASATVSPAPQRARAPALPVPQAERTGAAIAPPAATAAAETPAAETPAAVQPAAAPAPLRDKLVAVQLADVLVPDGEGAPVVLLMDSGARYVLPVVVESGAGRVLRVALKRDESLPPGSWELAHKAIRALGGEIDRVEVEESGDDFRGRIVVKRAGEEIRLDAAAGDALAVAQASGTTVYVQGGMLSSRGISRDAVTHRPGGIPSNLRTPDRL